MPDLHPDGSNARHPRGLYEPAWSHLHETGWVDQARAEADSHDEVQFGPKGLLFHPIYEIRGGWDQPYGGRHGTNDHHHHQLFSTPPLTLIFHHPDSNFPPCVLQVIFYDSDWNPAMDAQAQDRCHRIGQTREVHIYRLVSENTIEENILKKSDQKRQLDFLAIQSAGFTTDILQKINVRDFFGAAEGGRGGGSGMSAEEVRIALRSAEDDADVAAAAEAEKEAQGEAEEFAGEGLAKTAAGGGGEVSDDLSDDPEEKEGGRKRSLSPAAGGSASLLGDDAEIIPLMPEVVGQQGRTTQDILASLDATLKPIEKYGGCLSSETPLS